MSHQEQFNLNTFMTDSLSVQVNATSPTRTMFPCTPKDPYVQLVEQDPLQVLGETSFGQPQQISEHTVGTQIQESFRGVNILITGGTGFIGKILTEKLIRSIPHLGHIYLLIRSKGEKSSQERFDLLLEDRVFLRMKTEVPYYHSKISVIEGDISEPGLGLSAADRQLLTDTVHMVFHSAADVRFFVSIRVAIHSNVLGSKRVLDLVKEMKNLKSYIHVSTAFSQCVRRIIDETVPKMNINYKEILDFIKTKTDEELKEETSRILQGWPNTYVFSKAVCEDMLQEEAQGLPLCIIRPSAVLPTYWEPVRGWTDNPYGPIGLFMGAGHGIFHCWRINNELALDIVPADYTVNCMIAAAWRTSTCSNHDDIIVYNFTSTPIKPIPWKTLINFALSQKASWPFEGAVWYTSFCTTESYLVCDLAHYFLHRIPGVCFDKLAELAGHKPRLSKIYKRLETMKEQLKYFSFRSWEFKNDNVMKLWALLSDEDKKKFNFDVRDVDIKEHFLVSKLGVRFYYLKEKMENLPAARRKNTWLCWAHNSLKLICSLAVLKLMVITARALPL